MVRGRARPWVLSQGLHSPCQVSDEPVNSHFLKHGKPAELCTCCSPVVVGKDPRMAAGGETPPGGCQESEARRAEGCGRGGVRTLWGRSPANAWRHRPAISKQKRSAALMDPTSDCRVEAVKDSASDCLPFWLRAMGFRNFVKASCDHLLILSSERNQVVLLR